MVHGSILKLIGIAAIRQGEICPKDEPRRNLYRQLAKGMYFALKQRDEQRIC